MIHPHGTGDHAAINHRASSTSRGVWLPLILVAWASTALPRIASAQAAGEPSKPELIPGKEVRIDDPRTKGLGYWTLYLPTDYTPDRTWPVIFCFHGLDQKPKVWPFDRLTDRKGFIIVGMEYLQRGLRGIDRAAEAENLKRVATIVSKWLPIDPQLRFIGGFSKGGWHSSNVGERTADLWAGVVILGSGRSGSANASGLKGKPVYVGVGEKDSVHKSAVSAADLYKEAGAAVTFVTFKGKGHAVDTKDPTLKKWLRDNGPLRKVKSALDQAHKAERAGKMGRAHALFLAVAQMGDSDPERAAQAGASAGRIAKEAERALAEADAHIAKLNLREATRLAQETARKFDGSSFADRANEQLTKIRTDPALRGAVARNKLETRANEYEKRAEALEAKKKYAEAIRLYEQYAKAFKGASRYDAVVKHLAELKSDKTIMQAATESRVEQECKEWLNLADDYSKASRSDLAKKYLDKVIDKHPGTAWAKEASQKLKRLR